jgi:hypothetical protein
MKKIIAFAFAAVLFASCGTTSHRTLGQQYPAMYEEKPLTIAIMPPINRTTHAEAKDFFYTTMYMPLCEKGYYVYSPYLTMEMFQQESAYDAEQFIEGDLTPFRNVLNADAAMFTIIKDWRRNNVGGMLTVDVEYILRSTKTGQTLYDREGVIKVDTSVSSSGGGAFGAIVGLVATTISTAATDKVVAGRKCTAYVLSDLPAGKYSSFYEKDAKAPAGTKLVKATVK